MNHRRTQTIGLAGSLAIAIFARSAAADPLRLHLDAEGAHAVGGIQQSEFGYGANGRLTLEMPLARAVGVQAGVGALWLSQAASSSDARVASHGPGDMFGALAGVRFHPQGTVGPWLDVNGGIVQTGSLVRPAVAAHVGWDFRVGAASSPWDVGPVIGYEQIVEPANGMFPGDARVVLIGLHVAFGSPHEAPRPSGVEFAAVPTPRARKVALPASPSMAPPDSDGDGVADADDACPLVPGLLTATPETNGCPAAAEDVLVTRDQIVLGDKIYFDFDVARVRKQSYRIVRALAEYIIAHSEFEEISIEGHADEVGDDDYNDRLSQDRADAVRALLVEAFHVDARSLQTKGWGKRRPLAEGHSEEVRQQNRRVEFHITRAQKPVEAPSTKTSELGPTLKGSQ